MAGHSKWANIKRRKESQDEKRGRTFSKLSRLISVTAREVGSSSPESSPRLKALVDQAKAANMPKENINRALRAGRVGQGRVKNFIVEGYGPGGVAVLVEVATDNRQRTVQQVKNIFRRARGSLTEPGSVSFQFSRLAAVTLCQLNQEEVLSLMDDRAVIDFEQNRTKVTFYLRLKNLEQFKNRVENMGAEIASSKIIMKPSSFLTIDSAGKKEALCFLDKLRASDNVLRVFSNVKPTKNE